MKKQSKFFQSIAGVALGTVLVLMIPLVAMQFTDEVNWGVGDFIIAGVLLFGAGLSYVLLTRSGANIIHRAASGLAIGTTLLLIWANLAVGLIGAGPNVGNLLYIGVVAVVIMGTIRSRFTPRGMELTMFASSLAVVLIAVIALITKMHAYPGSSVVEIIGVSALFATLFAVSGLLFRHVALNQSPKKTEG